MVKRELGAYFAIGLLVFVVAIIAYSLDSGITGFVTFGEDSTTGFDGEMLNVSFNDSLGAIVLNLNETSGTYTSGVFDVGNESSWNNLTFFGNDLSFEVKSCSLISCAEEFSNPSSVDGLINLSSLNPSQYFQYKVSFNSNLSNLTSVYINYDVVEIEEAPVSLNIISPQNTTYDNKTQLVNISQGLEFDEIIYNWNGNNETYYNETYVEFAEGSNTLLVWGNNSGNITSLGVSFSVVLPVLGCTDSSATNYDSGATEDDGSCNYAEDEEESEESSEESESSESVSSDSYQQPTFQKSSPPASALTSNEISAVKLSPNETQDFSWIVSNEGDSFLFSCEFSISGENSDWIVFSTDTKNFNPSESLTYDFTVSVPENSQDSDYSFSASLSCIGDSVSRDFTLTVEEEKIDFELLDAQRTRQDRVRVLYSLSELIGESQDVEVSFILTDSNGTLAAQVEENHTIEANSSEEFSLNIEVNETLEGEIDLDVSYNSEIYSSSVQEKITLGAPIGGFAVFEGFGAGTAIIVIVVAAVLVLVLFFARKMRKSKKTLKNLIDDKK